VGRWEFIEHRNTAKRLRTSFVSLCRFFGNAPVSSITTGRARIRYVASRSQAIGTPSASTCLRARKRRCTSTPRSDSPRFTTSVGWINQGCRPEETLDLQTTDVDLERSRLTIRDGKSRAARRQLRLTAESREICTRRVVASDSRWLFPGKMPGTRLAKLNGRHADVLDALATCKCAHRQDQHKDGKCACGCVEFRETSRLGFVIYDFRHTFATRAAESGMPVATLAAILEHADLRSVMKYIHVRQEAQDRAMEQFEAQTEARNISTERRWSGFGPVDSAENRENEGSGGNVREGLTKEKSTKLLEARGGIEPPNKGFADLCLTTWLPRRFSWGYFHR
jgi:integrase